MDTSEEVDPSDETSPPTLKEDVLFDLLQNNRRRALLRQLDERGETQLSELAKLIAAEESDDEPPHVSDDAAQSVYISLYQTHVPKLVEHDIVDYDRSESTVELRPAATQLLSHIYFDEYHEYDQETCKSSWFDFFDRLFGE